MLALLTAFSAVLRDDVSHSSAPGGMPAAVASSAITCASLTVALPPPDSSSRGAAPASYSDMARATLRRS